MVDTGNPVSAAIYQWRLAVNLTAAQLAEAINWPASKLSRIENARQRPSASDIQTIGDACRVPGHDIRSVVEQLDDFEVRPVASRTPYQTVMLQLGFVRLPDGGWACSEKAARSLVETMQDYVDI